jgi:hypothetical protein
VELKGQGIEHVLILTLDRKALGKQGGNVLFWEWPVEELFDLV